MDPSTLLNGDGSEPSITSLIEQLTMLCLTSGSSANRAALACACVFRALAIGAGFDATERLDLLRALDKHL